MFIIDFMCGLWRNVFKGVLPSCYLHCIQVFAPFVGLSKINVEVFWLDSVINVVDNSQLMDEVILFAKPDDIE